MSKPKPSDASSDHELRPTDPSTLKRNYLPKTFRITSWEDLEQHFHELLNREIHSLSDLKQWILDRSEVDAAATEEFARRYINTTRDTRRKDFLESFQFFAETITPKLSNVGNELNLKMLASPFLTDLENGDLHVYIRSVRNETELFRDENVPLFTQIELADQEYNTLIGAMTIEHEGKTLTMPQAAKVLKSDDRTLRETIYRKIAARRIQDRDKLDDIFDRMLGLRQAIARNAGFDNYRDYAFRAKERFDYTPQDCLDFHAAIRQEIVPVIATFNEQRRQALGIDTLRPWDTEVDEDGKAPLQPFTDEADLIQRSINCFNKLDPYFGNCLSEMKSRGFLDLESRVGKGAGGYNYPLVETGIPFIFMNCSGTMRDVVVLMHEGGHAIHSFLTADIHPYYCRQTPHEVAELASMTMELFSMAHMQETFDLSDADYNRALTEKLKDAIELFPWVAAVDAFQHWLYTHEGHTREERRNAWKQLMNEFGSTATGIDWSGLEENLDHLWHKQGHIFSVPFYYIEYAIAQLGALAMWKNFRTDRQASLNAYKNALKLGATKDIREVYETAGISFSFSKAHMEDVISFARQHIPDEVQS
ncbi:MAG: M3 family oligoendopeptidase [Flavobacteriales bacterium]|nr:M3 family oligoendopeptidase [Flavobacteriales bacterium]MCB9447596.1 M3 family oligoendopeptidase [Flavobacteriales bacterium]